MKSPGLHSWFCVACLCGPCCRRTHILPFARFYISALCNFILFIHSFIYLVIFYFFVIQKVVNWLILLTNVPIKFQPQGFRLWNFRSLQTAAKGNEVLQKRDQNWLCSNFLEFLAGNIRGRLAKNGSGLHKGGSEEANLKNFSRCVNSQFKTVFLWKSNALQIIFSWSKYRNKWLV